MPVGPPPPPPSPSSPSQPVNSPSDGTRLEEINFPHTYDRLQDGNSGDEDVLARISEEAMVHRPAEGSVISETYYSYPNAASLLLQTIHHLQPWVTKNNDPDTYTPYDPATSDSEGKSGMSYENLTTPERPERPKTMPPRIECNSYDSPKVQRDDGLIIDDNHMYENGARKAVIPSLQNRSPEVTRDQEKSSESSPTPEASHTETEKGKEDGAVCMDLLQEPTKVHWSRRCSPKEYPNGDTRTQESTKVLWGSVVKLLENIVHDSNQRKVRRDSVSSKASSFLSSMPSYISPPTWLNECDRYDQTLPESVSMQNVQAMDRENERNYNLKDTFSITESLNEKLTPIKECETGTLRPKENGSLNDSVSARPDGASAASLLDQEDREKEETEQQKEEVKPEVPPRPFKRSHVDVVMSRWKARAKENAGKFKLRQEANRAQEKAVPRRSSSRHKKKWQVASLAPTFTYVVNELLTKSTTSRGRESHRSSRSSRVPPMGAESNKESLHGRIPHSPT